MVQKNFRSVFIIDEKKQRIFLLALIVFQGLGIRFISGQGYLLSLLVFLLSIKDIRFLKVNHSLYLLLIVCFLVLSKLLNSESFLFSDFSYFIAIVFSAFFVLIKYQNRQEFLEEEFFLVLQFFVRHALFGFVIAILVPQLFVKLNVMNKSFYYVFYVSNSTFAGISRNTGLFWEPGVYQIVANLYLFYSIKFNKNVKTLIVGLIAVLSSFSTAGFGILMINGLYFFINNYRVNKGASIRKMAFVFMLSVLLAPMIITNIKEKVDGGHTSGLARFRDILIGVALIKDKPIIGHGVFKIDYLKGKGYILDIEEDIFSKEYIDLTGDMSGGYTNGLFSVFCFFGIPIGLLLIYSFYNNRILWGNRLEKMTFCLIILLSMISEPIASTSFFLIFPFSYWLLKNKEVYYKKITA